jgi:hypothetical protein
MGSWGIECRYIGNRQIKECRGSIEIGIVIDVLNRRLSNHGKDCLSGSKRLRLEIN